MKKRNLPHIYPEGATFFITFRLKNAIPLEVLHIMQEERNLILSEIQRDEKRSEKEKEEACYVEEKRFFAKYDNALEKYMTDDDALKHPQVAQIVADKMHEYDTQYYDLIAYCIMSNHVHLLFSTANYSDVDVSKVMNMIKGGSAYLCNKVLKRTGSFWQKESYDHYVRNQKELHNIIRYIVENPVKAGLIQDWEAWPFTYYKM